MATLLELGGVGLVCAVILGLFMLFDRWAESRYHRREARRRNQARPWR